MSASQQSSAMDKSSQDFTKEDLINIRAMTNFLSSMENVEKRFGHDLAHIISVANYKLEQIQRREEEELKRKRAVPEEVNDFSVVNSGTLVKDCGPGTFGAARIGIVVGFTYFKDDLCGVVCWPEIHWEGRRLPCLTHPGRATLYNGERMPKIVMNANQQE